MLLHGSKRHFEVSIQSNKLTESISDILAVKRVGYLHDVKGMTVIKDSFLMDMGSVSYFEMIVTKDNLYACILYEKGNKASPPEVLSAFPVSQPYVQKHHV